MNKHIYAKQRFQNANQNIIDLYGAMREGDLEKWGEIIEQDPETARKVLNNEIDVSVLGIAHTGLNEIERRQVLDVAEAKIEDNEKQRQLILKENEKIEDEKMINTYNEIDGAVLAGKAGEADYIAAYNNGSIDMKLRNKGIRSARVIANQKMKKVSTESLIANDIKNEQPLFNYTDKEVGDYVNNEIALIGENRGQPLKLTEKAEHVKKYKGFNVFRIESTWNFITIE